MNSQRGQGGGCLRCGQVHERCSAHVFREGEQRPCGKYPIRGGRVCDKHGGAAPQVQASAGERLAQAEVLARYPKRSAAAVLLEAVHLADARARAAVDAGDPEAPLLQDRAAQLARVAVDKLGVDFESRVLDEQAEQIVALLEGVLGAIHSRLDDVILHRENFKKAQRLMEDWREWTAPIVVAELGKLDRAEREKGR